MTYGFILDEIVNIGKKITNWERINKLNIQPKISEQSKIVVNSRRDTYLGAYKGDFEDTELIIGMCCNTPLYGRDYAIKCTNTFTGSRVQLAEFIHATDKGLDKLYQKAISVYESRKRRNLLD